MIVNRALIFKYDWKTAQVKKTDWLWSAHAHYPGLAGRGEYYNVNILVAYFFVGCQ